MSFSDSLDPQATRWVHKSRGVTSCSARKHVGASDYILVWFLIKVRRWKNWIFGYLDIGIFGYMDIWYMDIWYMDIWIYGYMDKNDGRIFLGGGGCRPPPPDPRPPANLWGAPPFKLPWMGTKTTQPSKPATNQPSNRILVCCGPFAPLLVCPIQ